MIAAVTHHSPRLVTIIHFCPPAKALLICTKWVAWGGSAHFRGSQVKRNRCFGAGADPRLYLGCFASWRPRLRPSHRSPCSPSSKGHRLRAKPTQKLKLVLKSKEQQNQSTTKSLSWWLQNWDHIHITDYRREKAIPALALHCTMWATSPFREGGKETRRQ